MSYHYHSFENCYVRDWSEKIHECFWFESFKHAKAKHDFWIKIRRDYGREPYTTFEIVLDAQRFIVCDDVRSHVRFMRGVWVHGVNKNQEQSLVLKFGNLVVAGEDTEEDPARFVLFT